MNKQTISPISLLHHHHHHHNNNGFLQPKVFKATPTRLLNGNVNIADYLGKLHRHDHHHHQSSMVKCDDLFKCMRALLIFGKCIGLVPFSGVFSGGDLHRVKFRKCSISGLLSLSVIFILCCNTGLAIAGFFQEGGRDATQLAKNLAGTVCYSMGLYVFIFIFRNAQKLLSFFHKWREVDGAMQNIENDASLHFTVNIIAGAMLVSAIAENAVSHLLLFPLHERVKDPLKYYYENSHKQWAAMIPYHALAATGVFICNKWAVYAWNFGDIFIAVISRALYGKFKTFTKAVEEELTMTPREAEATEGGKMNWLQAIEHHARLSKLTEEFAGMLSPLVFTSFSVNIYFICIQLHLFLAPSKKLDFVSALYVGWSFLHLVARTYICALSAAKIDDYSHAFVKILHNCPRNLYTIDVERAERKLATDRVGLHGLGAFHIGRPFILSVISVIFTFEIVLLQTSQMTTPLAESITTGEQEGGLITDRNRMMSSSF